MASEANLTDAAADLRLTILGLAETYYELKSNLVEVQTLIETTDEWYNRIDDSNLDPTMKKDFLEDLDLLREDFLIAKHQVDSIKEAFRAGVLYLREFETVLEHTQYSVFETNRLQIFVKMSEEIAKQLKNQGDLVFNILDSMRNVLTSKNLFERFDLLTTKIMTGDLGIEGGREELHLLGKASDLILI